MGKKFEIAVELKAKDRASAVVAKFGRFVGGLGKGLATMPFRSIGQLNSMFERARSWAGGLNVLGVGIADVAIGIRDLAMSASSAGSSVADLNAQTGISTDTIQELRYAAGLSGMEVAELDNSLRKFSTTVGKGQLKAKTFNEQLGKKGAAAFVKQMNGARGANARLEIMLATMAGITDKQKQGAFGMALFGKQSAKMVGVLAAGLKKVRGDAHGSIGFMSEDDIERADEFGDLMDKALGGFDGAKVQFGLGLIETFLPEMRSLTGDIAKNGPKIREMVKNLGRTVGEGVVKAANGIAAAFKWVYDNGPAILDWAKALGIAIAAIKIASLVGDLGGLAAKVIGGGAGGAAATAAGSAAGGAAAAGGGSALKALVPWFAGAARVAGTAAAAIFLNPSDSLGSDHNPVAAEAELFAEQMRANQLRMPYDRNQPAYRNGIRERFIAYEGLRKAEEILGIGRDGAPVERGPERAQAQGRAATRDIMGGIMGGFASGAAPAARAEPQKVEVVVRVQDPAGVVESTEVKGATSGTGKRTTSSLKGDGR